MTYVVTENCIRCKFMDCVEVCPVDCFYVGANMLVIHPDECIDCGVCEPECPAEAIVPDSDDKSTPGWSGTVISPQSGRILPAKACRRRMPTNGRINRAKPNCFQRNQVSDNSHVHVLTAASHGIGLRLISGLTSDKVGAGYSG